MDVFPEDATYKNYEVVSSDNNVINVTGDIYEIVGTGNAILTFQGHDGVVKTFELKIIDVQKRFMAVFTVIVVVIAATVVIIFKRRKNRISIEK